MIEPRDIALLHRIIPRECGQPSKIDRQLGLRCPVRRKKPRFDGDQITALPGFGILQRRKDLLCGEHHLIGLHPTLARKLAAFGCTVAAFDEQCKQSPEHRNRRHCPEPRIAY